MNIMNNNTNTMNNDECTDLIFNRIKNNENSKLELAISKCPNLDINKLKNKEGHTLLLHAVKNNNIIGANFLLKLGASDKNNTNNNNINNNIYTFTAIENGNLDMLTLLKNNNFSLNKLDNDRNNLLHHYLISNINSYNNLKDNIVIFLLKENISLNSKNNDGFTPLNIIQTILKKEKKKKYQNINIIKLIETRIRMKMNIDKNQNDCIYSNLEEDVNNPSSPIMSSNYEDYKENSKKIYTAYYYPNIDETIDNDKCMEFVKEEIVEEEEGIQNNNTKVYENNAKVYRNNNTSAASSNTNKASANTGVASANTGVASDNTNNASDNTNNASANTGVASANTGVASDNTNNASANTGVASANTGVASDNTNNASANTNNASANTGVASANTGVASDNTNNASANTNNASANTGVASANTNNVSDKTKKEYSKTIDYTKKLKQFENLFNDKDLAYKTIKNQNVGYLYGCSCSDKGIKNGCEDHDVNWATVVGKSKCDSLLPYTKWGDGFFKFKIDDTTNKTVNVYKTKNNPNIGSKSPFINLREKLASIRKGKENYENYLENQNNIQKDKNNKLILITIVVLVIIFIIKLMNKK
jgi:hypothetical protein